MRGILSLLLCLLPVATLAGPWPRDAGQFYILTGHQGGSDGWSGLYAEYGLGRDLTFGVDLGGHVVGLPDLLATGFSEREVDGRARAFFRAPLPNPFPPWRTATELGVGQDFLSDGSRLNRLGLGASVGRGFTTPLGDGWTAVDFRTAFAAEATTRTNVGAVIGIKPHPRIAIELAAFAEHEESPAWQAGPTIQWSTGRLGDLRVGILHQSDEKAELVIGWALTF